MRDNDGRKLDHKTLEALRIRAVDQVGEGAHPEDVAAALGLHRKTVYAWLAKYREGGKDALKAQPVPGRPPKLVRRQLAQLPRLLARGAEAYGFSTAVWTTQRVADLLWKRFQVRYDRDHVCRLLHRFGWSWQKPARRARERDETAIQHWVQHTWHRLKKSPKAEGYAGLPR